MSKTLRVYGWTGFYNGLQMRFVVAASSWAEAARLAGKQNANYVRTYGSITRNVTECALTLAKPGVVFYVRIRDAYRTDVKYRKMLVRKTD